MKDVNTMSQGHQCGHRKVVSADLYKYMIRAGHIAL